MRYQLPTNTTTSAWDLPFGHARRFGANMPRWMDVVAVGWSLAIINTLSSGQTINLTYDPSATFIATDGSKNSAVYRPNLIGDPALPGSQQTVNAYFNAANVVVPTDVTHP